MGGSLGGLAPLKMGGLRGGLPPLIIKEVRIMGVWGPFGPPAGVWGRSPQPPEACPKGLLRRRRMSRSNRRSRSKIRKNRPKYTKYRDPHFTLIKSKMGAKLGLFLVPKSFEEHLFGFGQKRPPTSNFETTKKGFPLHF